MPALAEGEPSISVYAKDIVAQPGSEVEIPFQIETNIPIKSVQLKITLPEGMTFVPKGTFFMKDGVTDEDVEYNNYICFLDHPDTSDDWFFQVVEQTSKSSQTATVLLFDIENGTISEGDAPLMTILAKVDENADLTDKHITINEAKVALENSTSYNTLADGKPLLSSVTKGTKLYPEGYSLQIMPFAYNGDVVTDYILTNSAKLTKVDFYTTIESALVTNELYYNELNSSIKTKFRIEEKADANIIHITINRRSSNTFASGENTIAVLGLAEDEDNVLASGIYRVKLQHIRVTDVNGNIIEVEPYTADMYVGATTPVATPDENGVVVFHGNYADETAQALMTDALKSDDITTIDLSEVTAATEIVPQNLNAIIRCAKDLGLTQDNVVIGDECASLVLTDGYAFKNTEAFTATSASYTRKMDDHSWGTLCLPFAATSANANVYTLSSVTTGENGEMKFTQAASATVVANTPCVIKKDADEVTFTASRVEVPATPADSKVATSVAGWTLIGTTTDLNVADLSKAYFINGDHFWKAGSSLHVAPFRAYFEGASSAAKFRIAEETNGIETIENEAEAGVIYDLQGRAVKAAQAGQVYVQGAKKFIVK